MKNINILIFWELKNPTFRKWGGYSGGGALPKGGGSLDSLPIYRGFSKKEEGVFRGRGWYINAHYGGFKMETWAWWVNISLPFWEGFLDNKRNGTGSFGNEFLL